jgi:hypothetical protein
MIKIESEMAHTFFYSDSDEGVYITMLCIVDYISTLSFEQKEEEWSNLNHPSHVLGIPL